MKNEFKCSNMSFMHNHTLHGMTYCIKCILSETGIKRKGPWTRQELQKDFRKERRQSKKSKVFKEFQILTRLVINDKPGSVGAYWI